MSNAETLARGASLRAGAASTVAARIQSGATLIITSMTSRACSTAVRPRPMRLRPEGASPTGWRVFRRQRQHIAAVAVTAVRV